MNAINFVRSSLEMSTGFALKVAEDLKDAPLTFPTPKGGNHPLWVVGHLALAESQLVNEFILGKPSPYLHWAAVLGPGTEPVADAAIYPSYAEVLDAFKSVRAETLRVVGTLKDADLDQPNKAPAPISAFLPTIGDCLRAVIFHTAIHCGQLTDARRALGRQPIVFTPPNDAAKAANSQRAAAMPV